MDGSQEDGGNFLNLLQKERLPRKWGEGGGVPSEKREFPTLEETMLISAGYKIVSVFRRIEFYYPRSIFEGYLFEVKAISIS